MLQDMHDMEASHVFNVKDGTFDQFEPPKINILMVTRLEIVKLTIQHNFDFRVGFL